MPTPGSIMREAVNDMEKETADKTERRLEAGGGGGRSFPPPSSYISTKQIYDYLGRPAAKCKVGAHKSSFFILGIQFSSTMVNSGIATSLVLYLTTRLHESNASAASNVNNWTGTLYLCSLVGAVLGDAYLGRCLSSVISLFIYLIGMILATISVSLLSPRPPTCASGSRTCMKIATKQAKIFYFSIYVQALGYGAFQPCNVAFGADQFDEDDPMEEIQRSQYFCWLFIASSIGGFIGSSLIVYLEDHQGFQLGYLVSTVALGLSLLLYIAGIPAYRHEKLGHNPFTRILQVPIVAMHNYHVQVPEDANLLYQADDNQRRMLPHTNQFRFLDKAAIETTVERKEYCQVCTVTQVEEVKCLLRLMPIWATGIFFATIYNQITTSFVEQSSIMNTHVGNFKIPASSLNCFESFSVILCGMAYETLLVPVMRKISGNPRGITMLQRMGVGFVLSILAVINAAIVEIKRLEIVKHQKSANDITTLVPMSVFWLVPSFFLVGASEIFTFTGQYEFFYDQVPDSLRGIGSSLQLLSVAMGSFLSAGLVRVVTSITRKGNNPGWISNNLNDGHLDYFYWLLAVLGTLNFFLYMVFARWYKYKTFGGELGYQLLA